MTEQILLLILLAGLVLAIALVLWRRWQLQQLMASVEEAHVSRPRRWQVLPRKGGHHG